MAENLDHIRHLYLQKLAGTTTPKEDAELEAAMADPQIKQMCDELYELYNSPEMIELLRERPTNKRWDELAAQALEGAERSTRTIQLFRWVAAASVLVIVVTVMYSRYFHHPQPEIKELARLQPEFASDEVTINVAGGERIALRPNSSRLVANVKVKMGEDKTLRYEDPSGTADGWNQLEVPQRLDCRLVLSDGTEVWLNSKSSIRFPFTFSGDRREVEVSGEAYFNVSPDAGKPFVVQTPQGEVQVLGTTFNVNTYEPGKVVTSLVSGRIRAVGDGGTAELKPGQEAVWREDRELEVTAFDQREKLSWMQGVYYFKNADFQEIAKALERWYSLELVVDKPELAAYEFDVKLDKNKPLEEFMDVLRLSEGVRYRIEGKKLYVF
ncbi:FecR family protein [uncultured Chitinophaga sp.]|uniref:FecR family protein n=1 Tax=uncultured Chitinophaga sp. TaxID=339340 RepID=UPI00262301B8|nr:FecR family protein [uncultured Chitinophaga sp.]